MKQLMLATVASLVLSLPAMAQPNTQPNNNVPAPAQQSQQMNQMNSPGQSAQNSQARNGQQSQNRRQAENIIRPSQLSHRQVRQIQQALNKKGFDSKHVDGVWGRDTVDALNNFQKKNHLQGHGELTQQTLAQLGVNVNSNAQQGSATTGAGGHENGMNQPTQNPGVSNSDQSSQTNGQGESSGAQQMNQGPGQTSGSNGSSGSMSNSGQSSGATGNK